MLEMSAKHHIPQAKDIPYQPLLIKPIHVFNVLAHAEKQFLFSKLVFLNLSVLTSDSTFFIVVLGGGCTSLLTYQLGILGVGWIHDCDCIHV